MNPLIVWGDQLKVGLPLIDNQHEQLIALANQLYLAMKAQRGREVLNQLFVDLANYTIWHFDTEEKLMLENGFPNAAAHFHEHAELKRTVSELGKKAKHKQLEVTLETMNFLRDWLSRHINHTDRRLAEFIIAKQEGTPAKRPELRLVVNK